VLLLLLGRGRLLLLGQLLGQLLLLGRLLLLGQLLLLLALLLGLLLLLLLLGRTLFGTNKGAARPLSQGLTPGAWWHVLWSRCRYCTRARCVR